MTQSNSVNRRIVLHSRPLKIPTVDNFHLEASFIPEPKSGELLLRTMYLSLDPYMRGRMSDAPSYAPPVAIGDVMVGGTVSRVQLSRHPDFQEGDIVLSNCGWQDYELSDGSGLTRLDPLLIPPSLALGVLGMPGFTAYMGLLDIGQPKAGETVVVAAASGAVGSVVGQIAKIMGCNVVGITGAAHKCCYLVEELGFDACVNRQRFDFAEQLELACPEGIDVYFESVGGPVFDAVLPLLNPCARIPLCGLVSQYNDSGLPDGPDRLGLLTRTLLSKRIKMQGFIIYDDYGHRFDEFSRQMQVWISEGRIRYREDIVDGLEQAPGAFIGLLEGKNFGKLVVRVARA